MKKLLTLLLAFCVIFGAAAKKSTKSSSKSATYKTTSGITFRTFTKRALENPNGKKSKVAIQQPIARDIVVRNLMKLGFELVDSKAETREVYYGGEYYDTVIETYAKTINGQTTTVLLEEDYTEITFPTSKDASAFFKSAKATGLKQEGNELLDNSLIYWAGTNVKIEDNVITLTYRSEA